VHLCISSLFGRQFALGFARSVGGNKKAQSSAGGKMLLPPAVGLSLTDFRNLSYVALGDGSLTAFR